MPQPLQPLRSDGTPLGPEGQPLWACRALRVRALWPCGRAAEAARHELCLVLLGRAGRRLARQVVLEVGHRAERELLIDRAHALMDLPHERQHLYQRHAHGLLHLAQLGEQRLGT
eukprot:scaffold53688_cov57-Phaeocystis_antarctica.AAC.3